jgi:hypothetical protein
MTVAKHPLLPRATTSVHTPRAGVVVLVPTASALAVPLLLAALRRVCGNCRVGVCGNCRVVFP